MPFFVSCQLLVQVGHELFQLVSRSLVEIFVVRMNKVFVERHLATSKEQTTLRKVTQLLSGERTRGQQHHCIHRAISDAVSFQVQGSLELCTTIGILLVQPSQFHQSMQSQLGNRFLGLGKGSFDLLDQFRVEFDFRNISSGRRGVTSQEVT